MAEPTQALERTPTLLATNGDRGSVRVWHPDESKIRRLGQFTGTGAYLAYSIFNTVLDHWIHIPLFYAFLLFFAVPPLLFGMLIWYHCMQEMLPPECRKQGRSSTPSYITTDKWGIALTTSSGCIAVPWLEVVGWYSAGGLTYALLYLRSGEAVVVNFKGYSGNARKELPGLIREQCELGPRLANSPFTPLYFSWMKPGYRPLSEGRLKTPNGRIASGATKALSG